MHNSGVTVVEGSHSNGLIAMDSVTQQWCESIGECHTVVV